MVPTDDFKKKYLRATLVYIHVDLSRIKIILNHSYFVVSSVAFELYDIFDNKIMAILRDPSNLTEIYMTGLKKIYDTMQKYMIFYMTF